MAQNIITSSNVSNLFSRKVAGHNNQMFSGQEFPSVEAYYGPWESKALAYNTLVSRFGGVEYIPVAMTIAVIENGKAVEYWLDGNCASIDDLKRKMPELPSVLRVAGATSTTTNILTGEHSEGDVWIWVGEDSTTLFTVGSDEIQVNNGQLIVFLVDVDATADSPVTYDKVAVVATKVDLTEYITYSILEAGYYDKSEVDSINMDCLHTTGNENKNGNLSVVGTVIAKDNIQQDWTTISKDNIRIQGLGETDSTLISNKQTSKLPHGLDVGDSLTLGGTDVALEGHDHDYEDITLPSTGIPLTDLSSEVRTKLATFSLDSDGTILTITTPE